MAFVDSLIRSMKNAVIGRRNQKLMEELGQYGIKGIADEATKVDPGNMAERVAALKRRPLAPQLIIPLRCGWKCTVDQHYWESVIGKKSNFRRA